MCSTTVTGIGAIICKIGDILNTSIPVIILLGIVYFVWGIVTYVIGDVEEAKKKGKNRIIYGIIGFTSIMSMWGLVNIIIKTFKLGTSNTDVVNFIQANKTIFGTSTCTVGTNLGTFLNYITCLIVNSVIPLILALAMTTFIWGVVQYVINSDEEAKKEKGKQFIIWGILGLVVMISVWGLVSIVGTTFGITGGIPQLKSN